MQKVMDHLETLRRYGQRLGPYLMLEILLPGGSLFALMLFLYQRRKLGIGRAGPRPALTLTRVLKFSSQGSCAAPAFCGLPAPCAPLSTIRSDP
jgi:hypothetical protein